MNLILVLLQPDQPPAADPHCQEGQDSAKNNPANPGSPASPGYCHTHSTCSAHDEEDREREMAAPGNVPEMTAEYGKETEDFYGEERQREDMSCGRQSRSKHSGGH